MKAINVTTSGDRVTVSGGSGSVTASVVNEEPTSERVVVAVLPQTAVPVDGSPPAARTPPTPGPTATVGRAPLEVGPGAREQVLVTFTQGAAPPGTYPVTMVAYPSGDAPEEYAACGQHVEVVVEGAGAPVAARRGFPWWMVGVAGTLVLLLAVVLMRPKTVLVPAVVGSTKAQAQQLLSDAGLTSNAKSRVGVPPLGVVTSQSPEPGAQVSQDTKVTFTVTIGIVAPDLSMKNLATATAELQMLGLEVATEDEQSEVAAGTVLAQSPPVGTEVGLGEKVTLTVASPALVPVPFLVGASRPVAVARLTALGLRPTVAVANCDLAGSLRSPCARVGATNPVEGTRVPKGSIVGVLVNRP